MQWSKLFLALFLAVLLSGAAKKKADTTAAPTVEAPASPAVPTATQLAADTAARQILDQAAKLRKDKQYTEALAAYTDLIATPGISADLLTRARLEKNSTAIEKAAADKPSLPAQILQSLIDFLVTAAKGAATIIVWIVILLLAVGLAAWLRSKFPAREGLLIDIQDLSATDKDNGSRMLSAELARILTPDPQASNADMILESMTDFEGGSSASIKPMVQLPGLDSMLNTTANVSIGPLQFTPATVLAVLRRFTDPGYERTASGTLLQKDTHAAMMLQVTVAHGEPLENSSWQFVEDAVDARQTLLRRAAARLFLLHADGKSVTSDPNSLEWVLKGFDLLRFASSGPPNQQKQRDAAACFQNALAHDPANWLARFNLSVICRQLGENELAIQNCMLLEQLLKNPPKSLSNHLAKHPEFTACVLYNRALALSKLPNWAANKCALQLLDTILAEPPSPLTLPAKSARAACLLFQFDRFKQSGPAANDKVAGVRNEIVEVKDSLEQAASGGALSRTVVMSYAVALNALGYMQDAEGNITHARASLELAVALQPDMVEAHINLGRLYRHARQKAADDWVVRARAHIAEALQVQPENREANYQMGRLLAHDAVRDFVNALIYFAKAAPHSFAAFHAGQIYCNPDFAGADLLKGIEQLRNSVSLASAFDFRLLELAERLLDAADKQCSTARTAIATAAAAKVPADIKDNCTRARHLQEAATKALERVAKDGEDHDRARAQRIARRATEVLASIQSLTAPKSEPISKEP
jgi:tetratricopeptide (TPR) repeat protein